MNKTNQSVAIELLEKGEFDWLTFWDSINKEIQKIRESYFAFLQFLQAFKIPEKARDEQILEAREKTVKSIYDLLYWVTKEKFNLAKAEENNLPLSRQLFHRSNTEIMMEETAWENEEIIEFRQAINNYIEEKNKKD